MVLFPKQRLYAVFFSIGAGILLTRTIIMFMQGALKQLVPWVAGLLLTELILDVGWIISGIWWWISNRKDKARMTLRLAAIAIILHAFRILIFVMGRLGPWIDFDYRPEYRPLPYTERGWLYFAAIMSVLGVIGVLIVWWVGRRSRMSNK
ncbi:MAG: hypothetical protein ACR2MT_07640 [Aurantibacter sp.]